MEKPCEVLLTPKAVTLLKALDHAAFLILQQAIKRLKEAPQLGKPLSGHLQGLHAWKVSRYRIVYAWRKEERRIVVVGAGLRKEGDRKDIYALLKRLHAKGVLSDVLQFLG